MKKFIAALFSAMLCLSSLGLPAAQADGSITTYLPYIALSSPLNVWTVSPETKIQPTTQPGAGAGIVLEGARGSTESYQIVVSARAALSGVNASAGDLSDGAGHTLSAAQLTFFREDFIDFAGTHENEPGNQPAPKSSPSGDSRVPDPLVPFIDPYTPGRAVGAPFTVPAGLNQPIWLDVTIPLGTFPGAYSGAITVSASGQPSARIPLSLTVWNLTLPDMSSVTTYFGMHVDPLLDYHSGISACSGSSCWLDNSLRARTIVRRYEELLHQHRAGAWENFVPDPDGERCSAPTSWKYYDEALAPYLNGSYWSDGVPSSWIPTPFSPGVSWGMESDCTQVQYIAVARAWAQHLKSKSWFDKALVYAYDEPPAEALADIAKNSSWMQQADPDWKARILDTVEPTPADISTLGPALGIFTVALSGYDHWAHDSSLPAAETAYGRSQWPALFAQGTQLWFYESNAQSAPYPTFASNTLLGYEPRIMLWGAWYEHASGFLLWDTTAWTQASPWGPNVGWGKSGDGVLIYPGNHDGALGPAGSPAGVAIDGPIPSYRLKMVRDGLQDWALFKLADQKGLGDYARAQVAVVYGQLGGCTWEGCPPKVNGQFFWKTDDTLMQQARHNIAAAVMQAQ
jgi:hypothetical protein